VFGRIFCLKKHSLHPTTTTTTAMSAAALANLHVSHTRFMKNIINLTGSDIWAVSLKCDQIPVFARMRYDPQNGVKLERHRIGSEELEVHQFVTSRVGETYKFATRRRRRQLLPPEFHRKTLVVTSSQLHDIISVKENWYSGCVLLTPLRKEIRTLAWEQDVFREVVVDFYSFDFETMENMEKEETEEVVMKQQQEADMEAATEQMASLVVGAHASEEP